MTQRKATINFSLTAENQFSDPILMDVGTRMDLSLRGTFVASVSLQRSSDSGVSWQNVEVYTEALEVQSKVLARTNLFRIGIETGDYVSGTATGKLERI